MHFWNISSICGAQLKKTFKYITYIDEQAKTKDQELSFRQTTNSLNNGKYCNTGFSGGSIFKQS